MRRKSQHNSRSSRTGSRLRSQSGRVSLTVAAVIAVLLTLGIAAMTQLSGETKVVEAAPVKIAINSVTNNGGGSFTVNGDWSISGGQCWSPGNRFHGYIIVFKSPTGTNPDVPTVTFLDKAPGGIGLEDEITSSDPDFLGFVMPAPCNIVNDGPGDTCVTATCEPRSGAERNADNEPWSKTVTLSENAFVCAAVLHQTTTGADADATDCTPSIIIVNQTFEVRKDFLPNSSDEVTVSLDCGPGATLSNADPTATEADPANWTVSVGVGQDPTCTGTEIVPPGYTASNGGTCSALLSVGFCTITNTLNSATFTVDKDFSDNNQAEVTVNLSCASGSVATNDGTASEADDANFTVNGFSGDPLCTATESGVPAGYTPANGGQCSALLSVGTCTIVNTLNSATFTVDKDFSDNNQAEVTVNLSCASGSVATNDGTASEADDANFTVNGFSGDPLCTATESGVPAGYTPANGGQCSALLSVGTCTIVNRLNPPEIDTDKRADPTSLPETGGSVEYTVKVTNTGTVPVTLTVLTDNVFGDLDGKGDCSVPQTIAVGASYECSFTESLPAGDPGEVHVNKLCAVAENSLKETTGEVCDIATVLFTDVLPAIDVVKSANPGSVPETGGSVTFTVSITNTGDVPATIESIVDDVFGDLADVNNPNVDGNSDCAALIGTTLQPDASVSCNFVAEIDGEPGVDHVNEVCVAAVDDDGETGDDRVEDCDTETVEIEPALGSITIRKDVPGTNGTNFTFADTIPGCNIGTLDDSPASATPQQRTCDGLVAGTYTVTENATDGWELDRIECLPGDDVTIQVVNRRVIIDLQPGQDVTCTFFNVALPPPPVTEVAPVVQVQPQVPLISEVLPTRLPATGYGPIDRTAPYAVLALGAGLIALLSFALAALLRRRGKSEA